MSLSKQLYLIIAIIFFIIFSGNFFISIKNTKEYLEIESSTKAQDTATLLGLSLKPLMKDKQDSEIESMIRAISNSGFYKEVRLEDANFTITQQELIQASTELNDSNWNIDEISIDAKYGRIEKIQSDSNMNQQLLELENEKAELDLIEEKENISYKYIPSEMYKKGGNITFNFTANNEKNHVNTFANLTINKVLVKEERNIKFDYVPKWFIDFIPINLDEKYSEISNGWNTTAIIYISPNPGEAYAKLYEQARGSIIYAVIAFILSMLLLFVFVQYLLRPLKKIEKLSQDIAKGKFGVIENLPWTTEIKNVAISMNDMSNKIKIIINKLNKNLKNLSEKLSQDELTKLELKPSFESDLREILIQKEDGYLLTIKIDDLSNYAKIHTDDEVDKFIIKFSDILKDANCSKNCQLQTYRFFGSEFVMIIKNSTKKDAEEICNKLKEKFNDFAKNFKIKEVAHIGGTPLNQLTSIDENLSSSNEAYEKAKLIGPNEYFISTNNESSRDMDSWRDLIFEIIDNVNFEVDFINNAYSLDINTKELIMQEAFTNAKDKDNNTIPIGSFVSIAEKYEKITEFDKAVISKVISHITNNNINHDICINLSLASISNNEFIIWLQKEISKNKKITSQLVFSITAYSAAKDIAVFKNFCDYIQSCGSKTIIKRFETKFIPTENLKDFNLDYIRLARDYTLSISEDQAKRSFIESINDLAHLLNIKVIAEDVKDNKDYEVVKKFKLHGASR